MVARAIASSYRPSPPRSCKLPIPRPVAFYPLDPSRPTLSPWSRTNTSVLRLPSPAQSPSELASLLPKRYEYFPVVSHILSDFHQGLNDAAARNSAYGAQSASDNLSYLRNPIWWAGITTRTFIFCFAYLMTGL